MATYLLGDIQGCYVPLRRMLDKIHFDPANDRLLCCGDLVNRGGRSLEVLELLESFGRNVTVTLGNHDLYLLADHVRYPGGNSRNPEFREVLRSPRRHRLVRWLQRQPLACWLADHGVLMVHAGVIPQWSLADTLARAGEVERALRSKTSASFLRRVSAGKSRRWKEERSGLARLRMICSILTRIRFCDAQGKVIWNASGPPGSQPKAYQPWFRHRHRATRDVRIAFGHWAALGVRVKKRYIALDSGCVWGGRLSAFRLEDEKLFQVPGRYG